MIPKAIKKYLKVPPFLKPFLSRDKKTEIKQIHSKRKMNLTPEKKAELEALCQQLFEKKELLTSGKFQFIGLSEIKKKIGTRWKGLSKIVYEMTEDVIDKHMGPGDIFIRYNDDTYIMIFAHASPTESAAKANLISEEIQQRLFELDEEELRNLTIKHATGAVTADMLMESGSLGNMFETMDDDFGDLEYGFQGETNEEDFSIETVDKTEVGTGHVSRQQALEDIDEKELPKLSYGYIPLWDTKRGALTTYLCLSNEFGTQKNPFDAHKDIYKKGSLSRRLALDKAILKIVMQELQDMEKDGRKFFIVCPVQHDIVYNTAAYENYRELLLEIPQEHRKFMSLLIMDMDDTQLRKDAYWFSKPLRTLCPNVFAEVPLRPDINFGYLHNSGVNVAGVRLDKDIMTEQQTLNLLNNFSAKAKTLKIPQTFVLNVSSLSITTSAVCAGFDLLGGSAIHEAVEKPDNVHRYHHADLIKGLSQQ